MTPNAIASPSNPTSIYGFSSNDIWISYVNGSLYHYNGFNWTKDTTIIIDKLGQMVIQSIWGNSSTDVYAVRYAGFVGGYYKGVIVHFDGSKWNVLDIPVVTTIFIRIRKSDLKRLKKLAKLKGLTIQDYISIKLRRIKPNGIS